MINIIDNKQTAKKYTDGVNQLFRLYRLRARIDAEDENAKEFFKIITSVQSGKLYSDDPVKKEILSDHLMNGISLAEIAQKHNFSNSYVYRLKQKITSDLAMLIFKVLIL